MRAFSGTTVGDQPAASNRRQPVRQTRTNPTRTASNLTQAQGSAPAHSADTERNVNPGFYPAITHFTDAITALPKEMIRHYTMLREVDAKTHGPEALLGQYINAALKTPLVPPRKPTGPRGGQSYIPPTIKPRTPPTSSGAAGRSRPESSSQPSGKDVDAWSLERRGQFHNIRMAMVEMLLTLDEKNHVLNTALDGLDKQMKRCNSSYPHIQDEISEEARYGSMTHWAYTEKSAEKKGMIAGERTRRAANNVAAQAAEADAVAIRSEARREALAARKHRHQHVDSDFDDERAINKKPQTGGKGRKAADASLGTSGIGLGIVNGAVPPPKRRKLEKSGLGTLPMERALASVYGNVGTGRGTAGSPRDIPGNETQPKKKGRGAAVAHGSVRKRSA